MTTDLLSALRETPGCGEDPECIVRHTLAVHHADECAPCFTRLAEAVIEKAVALNAGLSPFVTIGGHIIESEKALASLLAALRSETPR